MAIEYNFTLDMDRSKRDNNIAYARTGDVDSITINADLVLNGAAYTPTGTNAFFECVTPNGHSIRAAAQKSGSSVSVDLPSAAFQAAGVINVAYFRFETGGSDNPSYVESTEPFAIVVREGIGDNIDAGDYIEEWRQLADQLEAIVAEVEKKADQAEAAINEQREEVDQLKAQAQKAIAGDVTEVEGVAQSAIAAINKEKADVADAAEDISAAGEQAINSFKTNSQQAINQFNTNADAKLDEVDGMITEAQGDVDAAITQLETATDKAVSAMEDAIGGTTAGSLQNAINRTLKLDVADMTNITSNSSLSSFTKVGSYCCKTAAIAATIGDCPIDDGPFNMYVFSSSTSGQAMQLVVPIDLQGKPTAEWYVRFGTSSAMDKWSVIGGGADIAAGLGIDVTGDAQKTVTLDTTAFYQHHEAAGIIHGSTEVTGGGRIKKLTVYGNTRQNLWVNPSGTTNGVTLTANDDGSITLSGTTTGLANPYRQTYALRPGSTYTLSVDKVVQSSTDAANGCFLIEMHDSDSPLLAKYVGYGTTTAVTFAVPANTTFARLVFYCKSGNTVSGTYRVMLNEGSEAEPWCPPGINSVDELSVVTAGKNLLASAFGSVKYRSGAYGQADMPAPSSLSGREVAVSVYVDGEDVTAKPNWELYIGAFIGSVPATSVLTLGPTSKSGTVGDILDGTVIRFYANGSFWPTDCEIAVQLELGSTATAYEPPVVTTTPIDLDGHALCSLPDGTRDELTVDSTGNVTLTQRVGVATAPSEASGYRWHTDTPGGRASFPLGNVPVAPSGTQVGHILCDKLPPRINLGNPSYIAVTSDNRIYVRNPAITSAATAATVAGGATVLYPLATPQEVELPGISVPGLASPDYTIFTSSNVPAEIEAEVVKVDYLPPSDVYTKEEVDKKIEDAGMPDVVPVSQGGTGVTTAAAERNRLGLGNTIGALPVANGGTGVTTATAERNRLGLGNTTGAVPIANGGTGGTTAKAAQYNLLAGMSTDAGSVNDDTTMVYAYGTGSAGLGAVYKSPMTTIWVYIAAKIRSIFGFNSSNVLTVAKGGTGSTSTKAAQNSLLNDMDVSSDALTDSSMLVGYNASPSASNGAVHKRSALTIWNYVVGKIRSTFGFTSSNVLPVTHGGTGITANPSMLVNLGSGSASSVLTSSPRPGVTGTLPVSHGGTGATAPGVNMLKNLGITFGTAEPPSTGTPGSIYIQYFE